MIQKILFFKIIFIDISNGMVSIDLVVGFGRDVRGWCGFVLFLFGSLGMVVLVFFLFLFLCLGLLCV